MRIFITGGFGFIGGRLAVHLSEAGHQIVLGSRKPISSVAWLPQAEVLQIEWDDYQALERSCNNVDLVIHAAGMNAQDCTSDPVGALVFNGVATTRLVAAASNAGVKRFIYISTAHVYASPLKGIITEETCPCNLHPYATSHLAGENVVLGASNRGQIDGIVLRLSNAFGAPVDKDVNCWMLLVNDLCRQAVQTRELMLQTNGLQLWDFIAQSDVCRVVNNLAVYNGASIQTSIFNLGTGVSSSVLSMAELIQKRCTQVLGFEPALKIAEGALNEKQLMLHYRTDKLDAIGIYTRSTGTTQEIDSLLRFCQTAFNKTQIPSS